MLTHLKERQELRTEVGRDPVDGSWYIDLNGAGGHLRATMTPDQACSMALGILHALELHGFRSNVEWRRWIGPR